MNGILKQIAVWLGIASRENALTSKLVIMDSCNRSTGKMLHSKFHVGGVFDIVAKHADGTVFAERLGIPNTVTNTGVASMAGLFLTDIGGTAYDYIAVGTGTTPAAVTDTTLGTEIAAGGLARAAATGTRITTTVTNDTAQLVYEFTLTSGSYNVSETGVFNDPSAGTMSARSTFTAVPLTTVGDSIKITYKIKFATS